MQDYELTIIFTTDLTEDMADVIIKTLGIEVTGKQDLGKRLLAYPIKKHKEGYYLLCDVKAEKKQMDSVMKLLNIHDNVLRYLAVTKN